jgi:hypothetical protein
MVTCAMADFSWYAEASLVGAEHVYCAGYLAQCVRRWKRMPEDEKTHSFIKLKKITDGHIRLDRAEIERLALEPGLSSV